MTELAAEAPRGRAAYKAEQAAQKAAERKAKWASVWMWIWMKSWPGRLLRWLGREFVAILVLLGLKKGDKPSIWATFSYYGKGDQPAAEPSDTAAASSASDGVPGYTRIRGTALPDSTDDEVDTTPSATPPITQHLDDEEPDERGEDEATGGDVPPAEDAGASEESHNSNLRTFLAILAVLAVLGVAAWLILGSLWGDRYRSNQADTKPPAQEQAHASVPATAPVEADVPADDFVIDMPRRDGHRLNADGVKVKDNAEAFRAQIADQAMHDPMTLFLYYNASPLGKVDPITSETDLVKDGIIKDGNVFSEEGRKRYEEWAVLWKVADIKSVREITFQGVNTGVDGGRTTQSNGVTGDNKAGYDIAYKDAQGNTAGEHSALERCTQPTAGKRIPGPGEGPTDNPKPEEKLKPKSGDKRDYKRPGDGNERDSGTGEKPKAKVTTPAEDKPPAVSTKKPGGGGVVDEPTKKPGSESGVTAPGADAPGEERDDPPPNEGGSNDGTVDGF